MGTLANPTQKGKGDLGLVPICGRGTEKGHCVFSCLSFWMRFVMMAFPDQPSTSVCQTFMEWAIKKGVDYFKKQPLEEHVLCFFTDCGLMIKRFLAHVLIGRLVRRRNRTNR